MTNALTEIRAGLATSLSAVGFNAFTTVPENWTPPGVFIGPDLPYLDYEGATFGGVLVRNQLTLVASAGTNEAQASELDDAIISALAALKQAGLQADTVDQPGRVSINGQGYLAVAVHLTPEEIRL